MFSIKEGTEVKVIRDGREWYSQNFKAHTTRHDNLFDKEEMTIDPTGIASWCPPLNGVTVGSSYAKAGWYGFRRDGWTLLVPASKCEYIG